MKLTKLLNKTVLIILFLFATFSFAQTGIKITYLNGTSQDYTIATSGKLYFLGNNLLVKTSSSANDVTIPTNIVRKLTFTTATLATQEIGLNKNQIKLYPNPSSNIIRISSDKKEVLNVKIYSTEGRLILSGNYHPNQDIEISTFNEGFYLVQANNTTLKLIKK